jgi:hypothetical protein
MGDRLHLAHPHLLKLDRFELRRLLLGQLSQNWLFQRLVVAKSDVGADGMAQRLDVMAFGARL